MGGGGSADEEAEVLSAFARLIPTPGRVLYLPIAAEQVDQNQQEYREWIELALGAYGDFDIDLWSSLSARKPSELNKFEAVFIGGGNTFNLLHQLRRYNFDQAIKAFVGQRKPIYGGSAGAIVLGRSISTASHYDQNYVGLADLSGLWTCVTARTSGATILQTKQVRLSCMFANQGRQSLPSLKLPACSLQRKGISP